jgi:iron complex outermembrane recepter protein
MKRTLFVLLVLTHFISPAFAEQSKTTTLPEVLVTDRKTSSVVPDTAAARDEMRQTPGGVSVVAKEDYATGRASTPQDILGWVPGLHVQQRDTASLESRISVRGSGLQRAFHLRGINLLQDGIPLNQADGGGDAQRIEPLAVDYTEVFRGGNALRYGGTTLGGAINFVSPTGYSADLFQSRLEFGSFDYIRSQISSGQVLGPWDYYASMSQFKQDGFRDHTDQDNYSVYSNVGYKLNDQVETRVYVTFIEAKSKLGGGLTKNQLFTDPEQGNATSISQNRKRDFEFLRVASKTTFTNDPQKLDLTGFWSSYDLFHPISPVIYQDDDDWGGEARYSNEEDLFGRKNDFVLGLGSSIGYVDDDRYNNVGGEPVGTAAEFDNTAFNLNLYGEDHFYVVDPMALVAGAQGIYSTRDVLDYFMPNGDDSGYTSYRSFNPKAGVLYDVTETVQAFFNYNKSFEPPSFSELANSAGDYRPNKAQSSDTLEVGTRGTHDRFEWDATYYHSTLDNELLTINTPTGTVLGTINAPSETIHQGVELGAGVRLWDELIVHNADRKDEVSLRLLYNWNDFRFGGDPTFGDNQLPAFPEHFFKAEVLYEHPNGVYFGPNLERTFEEYPIDMANTFFADPYSIWGFKAGYRTKKGLSFFFEAKNLSDEIYAASTGIVANAAGLDQAQFNPGTGRSYFGGVEWKW